jgi:hypothetical protein
LISQLLQVTTTEPPEPFVTGQSATGGSGPCAAMDHDEGKGDTITVCLEYVPPRGDDISEMGEMENGVPVFVR